MSQHSHTVIPGPSRPMSMEFYGTPARPRRLARVVIALLSVGMLAGAVSTGITYYQLTQQRAATQAAVSRERTTAITLTATLTAVQQELARAKDAKADVDAALSGTKDKLARASQAAKDLIVCVDGLSRFSSLLMSGGTPYSGDPLDEVKDVCHAGLNEAGPFTGTTASTPSI